jgi:hypothetical protein
MTPAMEKTPLDREEGEAVKLPQAATYLLEECRMVLPGIQALLGFQLIAVFNQRFAEDLTRFEQGLHYVSITLVAISVAIVMTPAAYHRIQGVDQVSQRFINNSSRLLLGGMVPLGIGLCLDYYLIGRLIFEGEWPALAAALLLAIFAFFWFLFPSSRHLQRLLDRR